MRARCGSSGFRASCLRPCYCGLARAATRGEPAAELHTLGSPPLLAAIVEQLGRHGARPAAPGEFTLRAFLAGRIDLTQAEAVLGIIDARGERELAAALAQMAGGLSRPVAALHDSLLDLLAQLEAGLDFVEDDLEFITRGAAELRTSSNRSCSRIEASMRSSAPRPARRDGPRRADGPAQRRQEQPVQCPDGSAALVSGQPGTTRDYLVARLNLTGTACDLIDTAGVEAAVSNDEVARQAQDRTTSQAEQAQIKLLCFEAGQALTPWQQLRLSAFDPKTEILVLTKADRADPQRGAICCWLIAPSKPACPAEGESIF